MTIEDHLFELSERYELLIKNGSINKFHDQIIRDKNRKYIDLKTNDIKLPFYQFKNKKLGVIDYRFGREVGVKIDEDDYFYENEYRMPILSIREWYLYFKLTKTFG